MTTKTPKTPAGRWDGTAVYVRAEGVIQRSIAGESLLVPIRMDVADMQAIFTLNPIGDVIWGHLDGTLRLDDILAALVERYEVTPEEARADLAAFIERLGDERLVERRP